MSERFPKSARLLRSREFRAVEKSGRVAANESLVVKALPNGTGFSRLGLAVSRAAGNAVVRNRWKRLIREAFRRNARAVPAGLDLVVRPRAGAKPVAEEVVRSLVDLAKRLHRRLGLNERATRDSHL